MNILLLEPDYKSTYPPLGLMKLAYYHKEKRDDFVWFAKGKATGISDKIKAQMKHSKYYLERYNIDEFLSEADNIIENKMWDRVYITTLFTFEWDKTIATINYAKSNSYILATTRGCGMKCSFCAVQKLEPECVCGLCSN